jgi:hypothetical protein
MMSFFQVLMLLLLIAISLWGWGRGTGKLLYGSFPKECFYSITLGLAVVAIPGGISNVLGIAYSPVLWGIICVGWLLAVLSLRDFRTLHTSFPWILIVGGTFIVVLIFLIATLMPSYTLNFHDDFHTYLARPVRMLQTGSLFGGWFDLLGLDSLGGHAFYQGLFLLTLPMEYINGFDGVFCTALAVGLAGELARRLGVHPLYAVTAMASLILINPQTVNVSTLYSGVVVIQGLIFSTLLWGEAMVARTGRVPHGPAIAVGLFLGVLVVLKLTLVIYASAFFFLWLGSALLHYQERRTVLISALVVILAAIFTLIPWIVLHRDNLLVALSRFLSGELIYSNDGGTTWPGVSSLFSNRELFYGGGYIDYALLVAFLLVAGMTTLAILLRRSRQPQMGVYLVPLLAASMATVLVYLVNPYMTDAETAIRYTCPLIIAAVPFVIAVSGLYFRDTEVSAHKFGGLTKPDIIVCTFFFLSLSVMFGDVLKQRIVRLMEARTLVSFPVRAAYVNYCEYALSPEAKKKVIQAQLSTEPGAGILTWVSQPYHLDFSRNRVVAASEPALLVPWLELPLEEDVDILRTFLLERGIRYVIWETTGNGVRNPREFKANLSSPYPIYRRVARKNLSFLKQLGALALQSSLVYRRNHIVVMDLGVGDKMHADG